MVEHNPNDEPASPGQDEAAQPGQDEERKGPAVDDSQQQYQQRIEENYRESGEAMKRRVKNFTESYAEDMKELHKRILDDAE